MCLDRLLDLAYSCDFYWIACVHYVSSLLEIWDEQYSDHYLVTVSLVVSLVWELRLSERTVLPGDGMARV